MEAEPIIVDLNARENRTYERFRSKWITREPGRESSVMDFALLLPDMVVLLLRLLRDSRVPLSAKIVALGGLGYVLSPIDILPEFLLGPIGILDDVVVVAAALSKLVNDVHPDVVHEHWPGQGDALEHIQSITEWAETLITKRLPLFVRRWFGS